MQIRKLWLALKSFKGLVKTQIFEPHLILLLSGAKKIVFLNRFLSETNDTSVGTTLWELLGKYLIEQWLCHKSMSQHKAQSIVLWPWANKSSNLYLALLRYQIKTIFKALNMMPGTYGYWITNYWMFLCYTKLGLKLCSNC